jgi:hypothetical protein
MSNEYVWCVVAKEWVLVCPCGPHEECPEHLLNCLVPFADEHAN